MFKIKQTPEFFWPVEVQVAGDGGKYERQSFDALFRRKSDTQIQEMRERIERGELTDRAFCREVLAGWKGISDEGQDVPFSETALEQVLDVPGVAAAIVLAYANAHSGVVRKN